MRIILAAAAAVAVVAVSGCDINTGPDKTARAACNCAAPVPQPDGMRGDAAEPPPSPDRRRHPHGRHRDYATAADRGHSYRWRREYAEVSVITYDYRSDSHGYYSDGGSAYAGDAADGGAYRPAPQGWIDGYGRAHGGGGAADTHGDGHGDRHGRDDPWHGYDVDCPNGTRR